MKEIYLDHSATTPIDPRVVEAMEPYLGACYGNPSSLHRKGVAARKGVQRARETIAECIGVSPEEVIFTSGGTEADNLALQGVARASRRRGRHIVTCVTEHPAVLESCRALENEGFEVTYLPVDETGAIDPDELAATIRKETILVSLMHANNEIGTIHPLETLGPLIKERNPRTAFHVDAVQSFGREEIDLEAMQIDLISVTAHKLYGPKGIGALIRRKGVHLLPLIHGGGQEGGWRSGTENVAGIVGFGRSVELVFAHRQEEVAQMTALRDRAIARITARIPQAHLNGPSPESGRRLCLNASFAFPGARAEILLHALEEAGIYTSAGSACAGGKISHVLTAIGLPEPLAKGTLRFSFGRSNTGGDIDVLVETLARLIEEPRGEE
ncbi:MAG: cysteine desulfurase [Deltaproteobacteria bacterium]|nr:MAG: cysteine desulfurase [Deltaproteobacteria bacterium]